MDSNPQSKSLPTTSALRKAVLRVVKRRSVHRDFLRAAKETEEHMSEKRPSTMFFYGL